MVYSGTQGPSVKFLPIYLASSASFPHVPLALAKLDHKQFLDGSLVIHVFASSCMLLASRSPPLCLLWSLAWFWRVCTALVI